MFEKPKSVSQRDFLDWLKIIFYEEKLFVDVKYSVPVVGGPDPDIGTVLETPLPPQVPIGSSSQTEQLISGAASLAGDLGQVIFQLILSYFLNNLWSMISTQ